MTLGVHILVKKKKLLLFRFPSMEHPLGVHIQVKFVLLLIYDITLHVKRAPLYPIVKR